MRSIYIFDQGLSLETVLLAIEKREGNTDLAESLTGFIELLNLLFFLIEIKRIFCFRVSMSGRSTCCVTSEARNAQVISIYICI